MSDFGCFVFWCRGLRWLRRVSLNGLTAPVATSFSLSLPLPRRSHPQSPAVDYLKRDAERQSAGSHGGMAPRS